MDRTTIAAGALVALGITLLAFWGMQDTEALPQGGPPESQLTATETSYDFGEISMARGTVETMFEITNPTGRDIMLESLTTSCMCTNAYIVNGASRRGPFGMPGHGGTVPKAQELVPSGGKLGIAVIYDPAAHGPAGVGPIGRSVYVEDATGGMLRLDIEATVTP